MFKMHEIREMIKLVDESSIQEFEVENEGAKVSIKKSGGAVVATPVVTTEPAPQPVIASAEPKVTETAQVAEPTPVAKEEASQPAAASKNIDDPNLHKITSPMVGTFYKSPEPGADAYVTPGAKVENNTIVCIVEAMKLFNEIEAEVSGEIVEVLVEDGQLVEYGQPLFLVKPE